MLQGVLGCAQDMFGMFGYLTEFQEYDIAHEISQIEVSDISEWLKSKIPPLES